MDNNIFSRMCTQYNDTNVGKSLENSTEATDKRVHIYKNVHVYKVYVCVVVVGKTQFGVSNEKKKKEEGFGAKDALARGIERGALARLKASTGGVHSLRGVAPIQCNVRDANGLKNARYIIHAESAKTPIYSKSGLERWKKKENDKPLWKRWKMLLWRRAWRWGARGTRCADKRYLSHCFHNFRNNPSALKCFCAAAIFFERAHYMHTHSYIYTTPGP